MSIFTKLFSSKKTKSIYILGGEIEFNGDEECYQFFKNQMTDEKTAKNFSEYLEFIFENETLKKAFNYDGEFKTEKLLLKSEIGINIPAINNNPLLNFFENKNGLHQLGGEKPEEFEFPENNCVVPFQYLGFINNSDKNFSWLGNKIHLICPIYLDFDKIYIDYSDPSKPILINREEIDSATTAYDEDLNKNSEIVFRSLKFDLKENTEFNEVCHSGIPFWIQYPEYPISPKNNKKMKFVIQINGGLDAERTNVNPKDEFYRHYYENMNFWGDGDLYFFYEPESKVGCYFIQNT
ncbi:hypothetical protein [Cloacibacterium caeni]|uniref:hypothetical protein n=1 Tax=Cloacibacterium caeni TaxID=2004710 RepID=UPI001BCBC5BF|nr:hypothetical protein [Cloacibacterium caeni]